MVLTIEEKLARLSKIEDWALYPPEQKAFLTGIANNIDPEVSYHQSYPERKNPRFHAGRLMQYKTIKRALEVIQYVKPEPEYSQREALEDITYRLRKQGLEDDTYIKLLGLLVKMKGWDKQKDPPKTPEEKQEDVNQTVVELEKKRREEG